MDIRQNIWGFTEEGRAVILYTMTNAAGAYVRLTNIGAAIVGIGVPDRQGKIVDVCPGFADYRDYFGDSAYLGKTAGRFAGRIKAARFTLDGTEYHLPRNNGKNHLHGGPNGLSEVLWESRVEVDRVVFSYVSPDGEERYPGTVGIEAVYDWNDACELEITYMAKTDKPTVLNLTNHVYFNLRGEGSGEITDHILQLNCPTYLPTDSGNVPLGDPAPVAGTPMDFTTPTRIGDRIDADTEQLRLGSGYDHYWIAGSWTPGQMAEIATLYDPVSHRTMTVTTDQPGVVFYAGNFMDGIGRDKNGKQHLRRGGLALECQHHPDAPNHPEYPSVRLDPDGDYLSRTIYRFGIR